MRSRWFTFLAMLALTLPAFSHAVSGAAVFGSFANEARAISLSREVADRLDILTRITEVEVNDKLYFRVLSSPQRERDAREIIRVAKQNATLPGVVETTKTSLCSSVLDRYPARSFLAANGLA